MRGAACCGHNVDWAALYPHQPFHTAFGYAGVLQSWRTMRSQVVSLTSQTDAFMRISELTLARWLT